MARRMRSESDMAVAETQESTQVDDQPAVNRPVTPKEQAVASLSQPRQEVPKLSEPSRRPGYGKGIIECRLFIVLARVDREGNPFPPLQYQDLGKLFRDADASMDNLTVNDEDIKALEAGHIPQVTPTIHGTIQVKTGRPRMDIQSKLREVLGNHPALLDIRVASPI